MTTSTVRTMTCPWCGGEASAMFVNTGSSLQQMEPYACSACDASQFYSPEERAMASFEEQRAGWWRSPHDESAVGEDELPIEETPLDF